MNTRTTNNSYDDFCQMLLDAYEELSEQTVGFRGMTTETDRDNTPTDVAAEAEKVERIEGLF